MTSMFSMIDALNHKKLILLLEREKEKEKIAEMLNERYTEEIYLEKLGRVQNLNSIQYLIAKMIMERGDGADELRRALVILMKKCSLCVYNARDCRGNNCLHYGGVLGDFEVTRIMLDSGVEMNKNDDGKYAYELCMDKRTKNLIWNYTTIYEENQKKNLDKEKKVTFKQDIIEGEYQSPIESSSNDTRGLNESIMSSKPNIVEQYVKIKEDLPFFEKSIIGKDIENELKTEYRVNQINIEDNDVKKLHDVETEKILVQKYPGKVFISINTIIGYYSDKDNIKLVGVKLIVNGEEKETNYYAPNSHIEIGELLIFNITEPMIKIKAFMIVEFNDNAISNILFKTKNNRKILKAKITINDEQINKFHNNLVVHEFQWQPYETANVFTAFKDFFSRRLPNASVLQTYISFISDDEYKYVNAPFPNDLNSLSFWIRYRVNSFYLWYKGFITLR
ncbi:hypothetical protein COBT_001894, partial [Conglomerata obtusa]